MSPNRPPHAGGNRRYRLPRRRFIRLGSGAGAVLLAGCTTASSPATDGESTAGAKGPSAAHGTFRLLVSDRPADIADFDSLDVVIDTARVFGGERSEAGGDSNAAGTPEPANITATAERTGGTSPAGPSTTEMPPPPTVEPSTERPESAASESDAAEPDDADAEGYVTLDVGGATVDLTEVVGDRAMPIYEGDLPEGRYTKIELYVGAVTGIVDGEPVDVTVPSGKLQIVSPFEIAMGETVSFVFDINVVKKGPSAEYNLLPVIAESGVAGTEVGVEEVGNESVHDPDEGDVDGDKSADADPAGDAAGGTGAKPGSGEPAGAGTNSSDDPEP